MPARRPARGRAEADALDRLARGPLRPFYLLHGEETFLVDRALALLRSRLLPEERPGSWRILWGDEEPSRLEAALEDIQSPLLFGGGQVLVIRDAAGLSDTVQERLVALLPTLGAGGALILVARSADRRRRLFAACVHEKVAFAFPLLRDARAAQSWVVRLARERGHEIDAAAAAGLIDRCGISLGALAGEVEKLCLRAGEGVRIGRAHVSEIVASTRVHDVGELTDRLTRRDAAGAMRALRRVLSSGEPPIRAVAFLAGSLRRALHLTELAERGLGPGEIGKRLGMEPWMVEQAVGRRRSADLERALHELRTLDRGLKRSRPAEVVFDATMLAVAGVSGRPRSTD